MITINNIYLKDFMSIKELSLAFNNNCIVAITGENGSGKSALLYAIAFAITGYRKGESYRDYVRTGCETAIVNMEATLKGYPVKYEIELAGNTKKAISPTKRTVTYRDKVYLNSDYNQFIKEHELDYIESLMFLFQGGGDIINVRPAERAATLRKLFQFEFGDIVKAFKNKQEESKIKNIELASQIKELEARVFEKQPLIRTITKEGIVEKKNKLADISNNLANIQNVDASSIKKYEDWLKDVEDNISTANNKLSKFNLELSSNKKLLKECQTKVAGLNLEEMYAEDRVLDEKVREAYSKKHELEEQSKDLQYEIKSLRRDLEEIEGQVAICKTGICHACGHTISPEYTATLVEKQKNISDELSAKSKAFNELGKLEKAAYNDVRTAEKAQDTWRSKIGEFETNSQYIERYETWIKNLKEKISDWSTSLEKLQKDKKRILKEKEELDKLKPLLEQRQSLEAQKQALTENIIKVEGDIIRNEEKKLANTLVEKQSKERDENVKKLTLEQNNVQLDIANTKQCIDIFDTSFPNYIILQACEQLEEFINDIVQRMFPYMRVSLKLSRSGVNFYYLSESSEEEWLAVSMASGAQKTILSLAYQVALAKMYGLTSIFLDEADAAMSDENAKIVYEFIANLNDFQQIFFISHRKEAIESMLDSGRDNVVLYKVANGEYDEV